MEFTDTINLFYDPRCNHFENEDGEIVFDIFEIVTPNDTYLFRGQHARLNDYMIVPHRYEKGVGVELHYPTEGDCSYCDNYELCHGDDESY